MKIRELLDLFSNPEKKEGCYSTPPQETDGVSLPYKFQSDLAKLAMPTAFRTRSYLDRRVKYDDTTSHPFIRDFSRRFCAECERYKIPIIPFEFRRGRKAQEKAKQNGMSKASYGRSPHNYGLAVDLVPWHPDGDWWDRRSLGEWETLAAIGMEVARKAKLPIESGGQQWGWDWPHFQIIDWKSRKRVIINDDKFDQHPLYSFSYWDSIERRAGHKTLSKRDPAFLGRYG